MDEKETHPLILAGAGHAHLVAMRQWLLAGFKPPAGTILLNPTDNAWYSGMMPGLLAGRYQPEDCAIPLQPLCEKLGIELIYGTVAHLDADKKTIISGQGQQYGYQVLSINTGASPPGPDIRMAEIPVTPVKPFTTFIQQWQQWLKLDEPAHLVILGGGAAAFEVSLALRKKLPQFDLSLICEKFLPDHPPGLASLAGSILKKRAVRLIDNQLIDQIKGDQLLNGDLAVTRCDGLVLATGSAPLSWYPASSLDCDDRGFIKVGNTLQNTAFAEVFAAGDAISLSGARHSGVYSVRQGTILARNIPALFEGKPLIEYTPQKNVLALLDTADGKALFSYANSAAYSLLFGLWKTYLDRRFVKKLRIA
ncbi:FAD-dependent oxidoreductase [Methylophaga sp. OBS4]|uniref:FAD-dependent oxidoreductase n=1 Tax=Methylophaga sp. OBS4 TaxID=2991935 RepID=UPI0022524D9B|nr:FAD-dependent oxidoreductase [Methylophaga sp. OBS4]MCX4186513.1 FAD-dependent oxidoreductase [Methylophaga sp. OBS4]